MEKYTPLSLWCCFSLTDSGFVTCTHLHCPFISTDVLDAVHQSPSFKPTHETPADVAVSGDNSPDGAISVFWSSYTANPVSPATQGGQGIEGQQGLLGVFFGAPLLQESDARGFLEYLAQRLGGKADAGVLGVECRAYRPYLRQGSSELVPTHRGTLVINCMAPPSESEASFNNWYSEDHMPMLSAVPGWVSSRRYMLIGSTYVSATAEQEDKGAPKYLALHEWVDDQAFETAEYKSAVDTPWRTEVIASVQEKQRFVLGYLGGLDNLACGRLG